MLRRGVFRQVDNDRSVFERSPGIVVTGMRKGEPVEILGFREARRIDPPCIECKVGPRGRRQIIEVPFAEIEGVAVNRLPFPKLLTL